jgi:dipeptidyl aminopeptidase/acylaminoacyl peptidase
MYMASSRFQHTVSSTTIGRAVVAAFWTYLMLVISSASALPQVKHTITFEDLSALKELDDVRLSPDGKWLAYTAGDAIWLMPTLHSAASRKIGSGTQPLWSPDSKVLAYYSGVSGDTQLWIFKLAAWHAEQITYVKGGINPSTWTGYIGMRGGPRYALDYGWAPDSGRVVFPSQVVVQRESKDLADINSGTPLMLTGDTPPSWTLSGVFRSGGFGAPPIVGGKIQWKRESGQDPPPVATNQLFIVDIKSKVTKPLTKAVDIYFNPVWSPDGRHILCLSNENRPLVGWGSGPTNIYVIDVSTGNETRLTSDDIFKRVPRWSPDGNWIAYLGQDRSFSQYLSMIPASGGKALSLTGNLDRDVEDFSWSANSRSLFINYANGPSWPIAEVRVVTEGIRDITIGEAYRSSLSISNTGMIAWKQSDAEGTGKIYALSPGDANPRLLKDLNPQIKTWALGVQQVVRWKNSRGQELEGTLIKPIGYKSGQRYPLIVDCYPGLTNGFKGWAMTGNQTWAAHGYVVFWPAARAPNQWQNPYKSPAFSGEAKGPKGIDVMLDDVMSGVEELIREGIVAPDRMGLYGFSNGGGVVNQLVARTARFKCAISVEAGSSTDWTSDFFFYTYNKILAANAGALPWEDPQAYAGLSVIFHLDKIHTPMLLAEGDDDGMFLLNSIELYNGLRWLGRSVTLLRYPGQGHGFTGPALRDFSLRVVEFFDSYLKPDQRITDQYLRQPNGRVPQTEPESSRPFGAGR